MIATDNTQTLVNALAKVDELQAKLQDAEIEWRYWHAVWDIIFEKCLDLNIIQEEDIAVNENQTPAECANSIVKAVERLAIIQAKLDRAVEALKQIADLDNRYYEKLGASAFDEPASAMQARKALTEINNESKTDDTK